MHSLALACCLCRALTTLVCGVFRCEGGPSPLFSLLPPIVHLAAADIRRTPALDSTLRLLLDEIDCARPETRCGGFGLSMRC